MRTHIYFDLDGTLTDPYVGISRCFLYALDQLGFEAPPETFLLSCIGPPLSDTFQRIVGDDLISKAIALYRERIDDIGWQENTPYDGIHDALDAVSKTDAQLFIATSKPHPAARRILSHFQLEHFFDAVYGAELDGTRSNKAELLAYAIELNGKADNRLMIGDRKHDMIGATANAMTPVGVTYGYGSRNELLASNAQAIADSPTELPTTIRSILIQ